VVDRVTEQLDLEYKKLSEQPMYSFDVLSEVDDFRITVGLYYVIGLAKELGIQSHLDPVLSFPLGSNVVTLLEATRMYEGLVTGKVTLFGQTKDSGPQDSVGIIDRIESEDGELLYRPKPNVKEVVDNKTALAVGSILENVVKFGTGREAGKTVRLPAMPEAEGKGAQPGQNDLHLSDMPVPLFGKTGTANKYINAAFLGYVPGVNDNGAGLKAEDGFAVGVYVGYDDNRSMRRGSTRISGALGALPTWCSTVNNILQQYHYTEKLDPVDISFYGLGMKRKNVGQVNLQADEDRGGALHEPMQAVSENNRNQSSIITFASQVDGGRIQLERQYQPYWKTEAMHAMKEN
jgi:membrane peptidoglycan carboxypeptidase